jgi:hypothetical protein
MLQGQTPNSPIEQGRMAASVSSVVSVEKERAGVHFSMSADQHGLGVDERLTQALNKAVSHYPCLSIEGLVEGK